VRGRCRARSPRHLGSSQEDKESSNGGADSIRKAAFFFNPRGISDSMMWSFNDGHECLEAGLGKVIAYTITRKCS
jgi:hypothetical protein